MTSALTPGDRRTAELAARGEWPSFVSLRQDDSFGLPAGGGSYDLIFADAPDGKWHGLDRTIAALSPHGMLIVDDMTPTADWPDTQRAEQSRVRQKLLTAPELISVELAHGSGVILSTRRLTDPPSPGPHNREI